MSTATVDRIESTRWNGYDDIGLPFSTWQGQVSAVGDASGGSTSCQLLFKIATQPLDGIFFNVEHLMVVKTFASGAADETAEVSTTRMGKLSANRFLTQPFWSLPLLAHFSGTLSSAQFGNQDRPLFFGAATTVALESSMVVTAGNPGVGEALRIFAQGFMWLPGAVLAPNGIRRPIDHLFGG